MARPLKGQHDSGKTSALDFTWRSCTVFWMDSENGAGDDADCIFMISNRMLLKSVGVIESLDPLRFRVSTQSIEPGGLTKIGGEPLQRAAARGRRIIWLGAPQTEFERAIAKVGGMIPSNPDDPDHSVMMAPVDFDNDLDSDVEADLEDLYELYYNVMANTVGWPTYHYDVPELDRLADGERAQQLVAERFVRRVMGLAKSGNTVVANDCHFPSIGLEFAKAIARRNAARPPDAKRFRLNVVALWHVPHPDPDFVAEHWPRDYARRHFDAMPYVKWWFHSDRWADNYAASVVEFASSYSLNLLVGGLDSATRDRLISKLSPARLTRLCRDVESETLREWLRTIDETATRQLIGKISDGKTQMRVLSLLPNVAGRDMQSIATSHVVEVMTEWESEIPPGDSTNEYEPDYCASEMIPPVSQGMFTLPGTINPDEMQLAARSKKVQAAMATLESELTTMNGEEPFGSLRLFWLARKADRKNAADIFCQAAIQIADRYQIEGKGPIALYFGGSRTRKGIGPHDRQWAIEVPWIERLRAHGNIHLIEIDGHDQVRLMAARRLCNVPVSGGRVGGRDVAGAEPLCAKLDGDEPCVLVQAEGAAFAETAEGIDADQSPFVEGHRKVKGAEIVDIGPDVKLPEWLETGDKQMDAKHKELVAVQRLAAAIIRVDDLRRNDPAKFAHRYRVLRAATLYLENGYGWFQYVVAQAHENRVLDIVSVRGAPLMKMVACAKQAVAEGRSIPHAAAQLLAAHGRLPVGATVLSADGSGARRTAGVEVHNATSVTAVNCVADTTDANGNGRHVAATGRRTTVVSDGLLH